MKPHSHSQEVGTIRCGVIVAPPPGFWVTEWVLKLDGLPRSSFSLTNGTDSVLCIWATLSPAISTEADCSNLHRKPFFRVIKIELEAPSYSKKRTPGSK